MTEKVSKISGVSLVIVDVGETHVKNHRDKVGPQHLVGNRNETEVHEVCWHPELPIDQHSCLKFLPPILDALRKPITLK